MYCRCREQTDRYLCRCHYQRDINPCRCQLRSCRCEKEEPKKTEPEVKEVKPEPIQQPVKEEKKEVKKNKWPFWKCVHCHDGKVRFLKTAKCPIPRRGYSLQRNPGCRCNKDDMFEPYVEYVYQKPIKPSPQNKKPETSTEQKKTENTSAKNNSKTKESNEKDTKNSKMSDKNTTKEDDEKNKHDKKHRKRNKSKRKGICCCSQQAAFNRPTCCNQNAHCCRQTNHCCLQTAHCCQNAHTSSRRMTCSCQRPAFENKCCKCKQAELAKLCEKTSYDCVKSYTKSGEAKFVCKKKKKPIDPCENTEEYALLLENGTLNPCDGPTQIIIVADPKCNDNPAIELFPIDPFAPVPPCECNAQQRQNETPPNTDAQNARSSVDAQNKSARPSLESSRKSVDTKARPSLETDKKKKKK